MKIGYSLGPLLSMEDVLRCASLADGHENVDSVWVPESWGRESFSTLGAVAQTTKRVRLGTSIISIFSRTPATIAMGAATLDMVSSNRTIIGLGTSTEAIVENWHGVEFEKPASRMKEYVECIRLMASGERVNYSGEFFKVSNFKMLNAPPRKHVPIFLAAVNRRMLALAAEKADGVLLYMRPLEELEKMVPELKERATASNFEVALSLICAVSDKEPEKARARAAKTLAFYVAVGKYYSKFLAENGYSDEVKHISEAYQKGGGDAAAEHVSPRMLEALTVCGTKDECRKALSRFSGSGVTLPILQFNPVQDAESSFRELLSTFSSA
ncbi:flavin-dependent oxidoreductase, F420-dependent methylene-tetrahydromethanopterin reductase [Candidatus Nitrososphaera evergladensis SR1]|uniref:Flavin-dependent oxidoreductase, F420-dependent methylene-tetrahydromethanopterin reductase n=1 Tax=Candidatus Nitrososphaera evergladensis SR1 TaxID=1459636 RepID=A0A075MRZ6_9ARCH|nr:LLM class flavin-dependent oxidoreductase [Candidatus Nitrososphaera evergladensis]AIF83875.1 flavin-dependent oxidoreductase, F420-dependent methylene-tetrahydromethanopterin reductase [Candidatus Nitrososphaera evergladensis SR1]